MKKIFVLTFVFALITFSKAWSQTEPTTTAKPKAAPTKDKTEQINKAEEKSGGAAYSGKGKGGEKDQVEKDKSKNKEKSKSKSKKAKKDPKSQDAQKVKEGEKPEAAKTKPTGDVPKPEGKQAPQPKKLEPKKAPTETAPKSKEGSSGN